MAELPNPSDLRYFLEVAHTENVSRAAERLGITQPSLSLSIQRLERSFGLPLLVRGKTGVKLTKAGDKLVLQTRGLLLDWERIRGDALKDETELRGRYTLGCHPSVGLYSLSAFLPALVAENPRLELKLVHDLSRRITEQVISFKADFGIVVNPVEHPDLVIRKLFADEVSFWIGGPRSAAQDPFSGKGVLICDPDLIQTQALLAQLKRKGMSFARTITSSSLEIIADLTGAGVGVGILPTRVARRAGGLKPVSKDLPRYDDLVCLIFRADSQKSKASRSLTQLIEAALRKPLGF